MQETLSPVQTVLAQINSEISINERGEGFISRRGLSRLLGVSPSLFQLLPTGAYRIGGKLAETLKQCGFDPHSSFSDERGIPDTVVGICADYYGSETNPHATAQARAVKMALLCSSVRELFRSVKGWEQGQQPPKRYSNDFLKFAAQAYQAACYSELISDQPGELHVWDSAEDCSKKLPGQVFLCDWIAHQPIQLTTKGKIRLGQMAAEQYKKSYQSNTPKATYKTFGRRPCYPVKFIPQLESCLFRVSQEPNTVVSEHQARAKFLG